MGSGDPQRRPTSIHWGPMGLHRGSIRENNGDNYWDFVIIMAVLGKQYNKIIFKIGVMA